nr:immunoglobulin heavy chain junction region [Macaca mulatta]
CARDWNFWRGYFGWFGVW